MSSPSSPVHQALREAAGSLVLSHELASHLARKPLRIQMPPAEGMHPLPYEIVHATRAGLSVEQLEDMCAADSTKQARMATLHHRAKLDDLPAEGEALPLPSVPESGVHLESQKARYFLMVRAAGVEGPNGVACLAGLGMNISTRVARDSSGAAAVTVNLDLIFDYIYTFIRHRRRGAANALLLAIYDAYLRELTDLAAQLQPAFAATGIPAKLNCTVYADLRSRSAASAYQILLKMVRDAHRLFKLTQLDEPALRSLKIETLEDASDLMPLMA